MAKERTQQRNRCGQLPNTVRYLHKITAHLGYSKFEPFNILIKIIIIEFHRTNGWINVTVIQTKSEIKEEKELGGRSATKMLQKLCDNELITIAEPALFNSLLLLCWLNWVDTIHGHCRHLSEMEKWRETIKNGDGVIVTNLSFIAIRDQIPGTPAVRSDPRKHSGCFIPAYSTHYFTHLLIRSEYNRS